MWEKAVAATLVIIGTQGFGCALCQEMQSKLYHEKEEKQMLLYMRNEIEFLHRPLQEIFDEIKDKVKEPYGTFLKNVSKRMQQGDGKTLKCLWYEELCKLEKGKSYPKEAMEYLKRIGENLGAAQDTFQSSALKLLQMELEDDINKNKKIKDEKTKLIQTLSLITGVFCVIVFV